MTILLDMDDVLEMLVDGWTRYLNDRFGTNVRPEDVHTWNISLAFPTLTYEQVYSADADEKLWDYVRPMPGAVESVKKLIDDGHDVYVVTATNRETLRAKMDKVLFRYFPFITWDKVIITKNKQLVKGDVLVDDGPHNLTGGEYRKILFDAAHNRNFDEKSVGAVRVKNWAEAMKEINRMATEFDKTDT